MNIGNNYKAQKKNILDLFKIYKEKRGDTYDGNDLDHLQNRVDALEGGKYIITVAGEVSSGKSTFINALLGEEILPTGVRQLTSAIVEIIKSESPYLHVVYADKSEEKYGENDDLFSKLETLCAIPEKYQNIPTTLLDKLIGRTKGHLIVDEQFVSHLEKRANKRLSQHKKILQDYIHNRKRDEIPIKIIFGYPLSWDFEELSIVDSPGVNALGGVQDITHEYLNNSNAVLFVQNIQQVELQSFREFVESQISSETRDENTLFLILTHAGLHPEETIISQTETARDLYSDLIRREQILPVDSLLKVISNDLTKGKKLKEIRSNEIKRRILADYRDQVEDLEVDLETLVSQASRFKKMEKAIDTFAMAAPFFQLSEILNALKGGYEKLDKLYQEKIGLKKQKTKDPSEFARSIERIQKELTDWRLIVRKSVEDVSEKFTGKDAEWKSEIEQIKLLYPEKFSDSSDIDEVRNHFENAINDLEKLTKSFTSSITQELNKRITAEDKKFSASHTITLPSIDLDSIEDKSRKNAFETKEKTKKIKKKVGEKRLWYTFYLMKKDVYEWRDVVVGKEEVFNEKKFLSEYKSVVNKSFYKVVNRLLDKPDKKGTLSRVYEKYIELFKSMVDEIIQSRMNALEIELSSQQTNKEILEEIQQLESKKKLFPAQIKRIDEIREDLS